MRYILPLILILAGGCKSLDRLSGSGTNEDTSHESRLVTVSCCRLNCESGDCTYPATVPVGHQNLCSEVRRLNAIDELYNGDVYLAVNNGCGLGNHEIGDEYYSGNPI